MYDSCVEGDTVVSDSDGGKSFDDWITFLECLDGIGDRLSAYFCEEAQDAEKAQGILKDLYLLQADLRKFVFSSGALDYIWGSLRQMDIDVSPAQKNRISEGLLLRLEEKVEERKRD